MNHYLITSILLSVGLLFLGCWYLITVYRANKHVAGLENWLIKQAELTNEYKALVEEKIKECRRLEKEAGALSLVVRDCNKETIRFKETIDQAFAGGFTEAKRGRDFHISLRKFKKDHGI